MADPQFQIRRRQPLAAQVHDTLRRMIRAQVFEPGERMVEEDLARRLAVSRTPVREALFRLQASGLVEQVDGRFVVLRLALRDIQEIFEIRRLLEPAAVAAVATATTPETLAAFEAARDRVLEAATVDAATEANVAFRSLWIGRITNRRLQETLARFDDQVVLVRRATLVEPGARQVARDGIARLVEAFAARDAAAAHRVMEQFVDDALAWFEHAVNAPADPD
ncbi:MAG: GntR family transcriptional regulator [Gemmobacter sp.]